MENVKIKVVSVISVIGGIIGNQLGGWDLALKTLCIFMIIDYSTGVIVGRVNKSPKTKNGGLSSKIGFKGICKKGMTLMIVLVAYRMDLLMDSEFMRNAVITGYIVNEIISILENAGLLGLYIPPVLKKGIEILNKKAEGDIEK